MYTHTHTTHHTTPHTHPPPPPPPTTTPTPPGHNTVLSLRIYVVGVTPT